MKKRISFHIFLWLTILFMSIIFRLNKFGLQDAIIVSISNVSIYMIVFYINSLIVFPRFYNGKRLTKFILINIAVILTFSVLYAPLELHFFSESLVHLSKRPIVVSILRNFFSSLFIVSVNTVFLLQEKMKEKEILSVKIIEEKLQAELMLLKSQINPHFLFNALNNIYSLSYLKSDKAPEGILLLSKMLRYIIEDCKEELLPLQSEIEYLETFIAFQDLRTATEINVKFEQKNIQKDLLISPLLFLSLLENSFKYSKIGEVKDSFVHIVMETNSDNKLIFEIENSLPATKASSGSGTGLENLQKRLDLVYPDRYHLVLDAKETKYKASLKIDLK